ncbi:phage holin family protein [Gordonia westfalica]|uniref:Putative Holin-X, holin superfamily III n=1 Tax=Gordonia westfalica TaxID=158898 RepID=A0A1H2KIV6_9ACTN|nr:phage holin family protein [Gordonia westfalica]SDU68321.1 Putative Holin-X, holin superfamily III [Gordonia westfalica]
MSPNEHGLPEAGRDSVPSIPRDSVPSIPLSDANAGPSGEPSIGSLVKDATASVSTLFRSEVALAKAELVGEAKKAGAGTGLLIVAGVMALYSSFFFFFFLAELLDEFVWRWLAFLIVFLILVVVTCIAAFVGYIFFKKVRGPKKTIETVNELSTVLPNRGPGHPQAPAHPRIPPAREG